MNPLVRPMLFAALISVSAARAEAQLGTLLGLGTEVPEISAEDVRQLQLSHEKAKREAEEQNASEPEPPFILVDVRSEEEYGVSVLPGAITAEQFESRRDDYRDRTVITYCTSGYRSERYAKKLVGEVENIRNFKGSILQWCESGYPLETLDREPTKRVHTNSARNKVPKQYQAVH